MSRGHAIVIGGGIAGLTVAQVLASRFARITVIERDAPAARAHVPHLPHTHILGAHGYKLMNRIFAGLDARLAAAGAPQFDFGDSPFFAGAWAPRRPVGLVTRSFTRALLERELRASLAENIHLEVGVRVASIVIADDRATSVLTEDGRMLDADFIVDAAGMGSRSAQLLASHGHGVVTRSEMDLAGAALTQLYRPRVETPEWVLFSVRPTVANHRCGAISRVEEGLWRVSVWGFGRCKPARDSQRAFAGLLATPAFGEILDGADPVSAPFYYACSASRWVHYDRLDTMPDGMAIIGDAAFRPNFDHAQGMTFCAMSAELLGEHLDRAELGSRPGTTLGFQKAYAALVAPWWEWNTAVEVSVASVEIQPTPRPDARGRMAAYRWLRRAALSDEILWKAVLEANQGARTPASLLTAEIYERASQIVAIPTGVATPT